MNTALGGGTALPRTYSVTSQADKSITLYLSDNANNKRNFLTLPVNPEQKQIQQPLRVTLTQTEGGIWIDNYGKSIPSLILSGDTGWRQLKGRFNGSPIDGQRAFGNLDNDIIQAYFDWQAAAKDPDSIRLRIADDVDGVTYNVIPSQSFQKQRNKNNPLLFRYTAQFIVIPSDKTINASIQSYPSKQVQAQQVTQQVKQSLPPVSPPDRTYTVKSGDSLWNIANNYYGDGSKAYALAKYNGIPNANLIYLGQVLKIPNSL